MNLELFVLLPLGLGRGVSLTSDVWRVDTVANIDETVAAGRDDEGIGVFVGLLWWPADVLPARNVRLLLGRLGVLLLFLDMWVRHISCLRCRKMFRKKCDAAS